MFYTTRRIIKEKLGNKPIDLNAWKLEHDRLRKEYAVLSPQHRPLREELLKIQRVQYCVDRVLKQQEPRKEPPPRKVHDMEH